MRGFSFKGLKTVNPSLPDSLHLVSSTATPLEPSVFDERKRITPAARSTDDHSSFFGSAAQRELRISRELCSRVAPIDKALPHRPGRNLSSYLFSLSHAARRERGLAAKIIASEALVGYPRTPQPRLLQPDIATRVRRHMAPVDTPVEEAGQERTHHALHMRLVFPVVAEELSHIRHIRMLSVDIGESPDVIQKKPSR
ncbi:hypothetical protein [Paraburkholderia sp. ZP32-5]|uniref:hypothetical protein n=1 Tax=Paraburkholderia sp. ZP32-5 TaxID=2883245 RepID=UPI001F3A0761|nr:hypothetical protein [Paraburkholderia sp. ZP32-5]